MPRDFKARIAIGNKHGTLSTIWVIATAKNEIYAVHRTSGTIEKISFHQSRICRRAFLGVPEGMDDRVMDRWIRAETMPAGSRSVVRLLSVGFPSGHVAATPNPIKKSVLLLDSAAPGRARGFELALTKEPRSTITALVEQGLANIHARVLATHQILTGETLVLFSTETESKFDGLIVPSSMHEVDDLVFPSAGPPADRTPLMFLTLYTLPKTGADCLMALELAGFRVPKGQAKVLYPNAGQLTRQRVFATQDTKIQPANGGAP
jgi:hypothetical protein